MGLIAWSYVKRDKHNLSLMQVTVLDTFGEKTFLGFD